MAGVDLYHVVRGRVRRWIGQGGQGVGDVLALDAAEDAVGLLGERRRAAAGGREVARGGELAIAHDGALILYGYTV